MEYRELNRSIWNQWTKLHLDSAMYNMEAFRRGESSLIGPETELLGDLQGRKVLHLQCHFGQDTLSLARLGAQITGVDLADEAVRTARGLADELGLQARFECGDVLDPDLLAGEQFDLVYTSYGVLIWLPDLDRWAANIHRLLRPGGRLVLIEFHPFCNLYDGEMNFRYSYFRDQAIREQEAGSYAAPEATHVTGETLTWDFSIADVLQPLLRQGLQLRDFREYDHSPYNLYKNAVRTEKGYRMKEAGGKIPYLFSVDMVRPA